MLIWEDVVEFCIEHANDLARFIADDLVLLDVVERRDRETSCVVRIDIEVYVSQMSKVFVKWIGPHIFSGKLFIRSCKSPTFLVEVRQQHSISYNIAHLSLTFPNERKCMG